jgi:hypothetical protein
LETILKKFDIAATAVTTLLVLDFILNNQAFVLEVDRFGKGSRDGMVGSFAFCNEALVTLNNGNGWILYFPFSDVAEGFATYGCLLGCLRRCPTFRPVICELFNKTAFNRGGLGNN